MAAPTSVAEAPKKPLPTESRPHRVDLMSSTGPRRMTAIRTDKSRASTASRKQGEGADEALIDGEAVVLHPDGGATSRRF